MKLLLCAAVLAALTLPAFAVAGPGPSPDPSGDRVTSRGYDERGRLLWERGVAMDDDAIAFERTYRHADGKAKPGPAVSADAALTDCASTKYVKAGWKWAAPYSLWADAHADRFAAAGEGWDAQSAADLFGSASAGKAGEAGARDGVNQVEFESLGASSTIAVTTTWYNRFTKLAVESDGQYNTYYPWATDGSPSAMDVENIAAHEVGHSLGLSHPKGAGGISCLTMYAYAGLGETQKRTLGDGDILGIKALYGA